MIIDYLTYFKKMGLKLDLSIQGKEKLSYLINELFSVYELEFTNNNKINVCENDDKYFLDIKKNHIALVPSKNNSVIKSWNIEFNKKTGDVFDLIYMENNKDMGTKYLSINYDLDKDILVNTNMYYFGASNEYNLSTVEKTNENKKMRKESLMSLLKNKKSSKNTDSIDKDLNKLIEINNEYSSKPDLSIYINSKYELGKNVLNEVYITENSKYNSKMIKNYIENNINDMEDNLLSSILKNYLDIIRDGINPYIMKQKKKKVNKCA